MLGQVRGNIKIGGPDFPQALAAYRTCARAEGLYPRTVEGTESAVRYFAEFLGSDIEFPRSPRTTSGALSPPCATAGK